MICECCRNVIKDYEKNQKRNNKIKKARKTILKAFEKDANFKRVYIANVACRIFDEVGTIEMLDCNEMAEKILYEVFG